MKTFLLSICCVLLFSIPTPAQQWYAQEYNLDVDYAMALSGYQKVRPQNQVRYQITPQVYYTPTFVYPSQQPRYYYPQQYQQTYRQTNYDPGVRAWNGGRALPGSAEYTLHLQQVHGIWNAHLMTPAQQQAAHSRAHH